MGTTVFFIMMSERPEYVDKIKASALLAPVVYMNNIKGVLRPLANYAEQIDAKLTELGIYEFAADPSKRSDEVINKFCSEGNVTTPLCYSFIYLICDLIQ
ncbi:hypothetical protein Avbf_05780 [Armadillidium vulgare]|nr:hypothetical protein Avbf_05780 [Armadillidium vulgare]